MAYRYRNTTLFDLERTRSDSARVGANEQGDIPEGSSEQNFSGVKADAPISGAISTATGIDRYTRDGTTSVKDVSCAKKVSFV